MVALDELRPAFRLRKLWLDAHLWIGVGLFVLLIPLSISGSLLVWRDGLDRLSNPERYVVSGKPASLSPSAYLAKASAALPPRAKPARINLPASGHDPVVVTARGKSGPGRRPPTTNVWLEPSDGHVLASGPGMGGAIGWLHEFHERLQIPSVGRQVVGWLGVAMLINCLTGLWLWWPRRGGISRGLKWSRSTSTNYNLHHMIGFWMAIPLAVLSASGAWISFPRQQARPPEAGGMKGARAVETDGSAAGRREDSHMAGQQSAGADHGDAGNQAASGERRHARGARGGEGDQDRGSTGPASGSEGGHVGAKRDVDQVVQAVLAATPGTRLVSVTLPSRGQDGVWQIELASPRGGRQTLRVSDGSGSAVPAAAQSGGGDPLMRLMHQVHEGHGAALWWRLIMTLAGLAPAILGITGVVIWLRRKRIVGTE